MDKLPAETKDAILDAIASNRKILAIKLYKDATGSDLKTAKDVIKSYMLGQYESGPDRFDGDFPGIDENEAELILDDIFNGRKLDAVKRYKTASERGLKDSKGFIEDLTQRLRTECPEQFRSVTGTGTGCASVLLVSIMVGITIATLVPPEPYERIPPPTGTCRTVTGVDDPDIDGNIAFTIVTITATSTDPDYNGL